MNEELINSINIKARIYPSREDCKSCIDIALLYDATPHCSNCHKEKDVIIIKFVKGILGSYGIVIDEKGNIKEVPIGLLKINKK